MNRVEAVHAIIQKAMNVLVLALVPDLDLIEIITMTESMGAPRR